MNNKPTSIPVPTTITCLHGHVTTQVNLWTPPHTYTKKWFWSNIIPFSKYARNFILWLETYRYTHTHIWSRIIYRKMLYVGNENWTHFTAKKHLNHKQQFCLGLWNYVQSTQPLKTHLVRYTTLVQRRTKISTYSTVGYQDN